MNEYTLFGSAPFLGVFGLNALLCKNNNNVNLQLKKQIFYVRQRCL